MYISEFCCGVAVVILIEFALLVAYGIYLNIKK